MSKSRARDSLVNILHYFNLLSSTRVSSSSPGDDPTSEVYTMFTHVFVNYLIHLKQIRNYTFTLKQKQIQILKTIKLNKLLTLLYIKTINFMVL